MLSPVSSKIERRSRRVCGFPEKSSQAIESGHKSCAVVFVPRRSRGGLGLGFHFGGYVILLLASPAGSGSGVLWNDCWTMAQTRSSGGRRVAGTGDHRSGVGAADEVGVTCPPSWRAASDGHPTESGRESVTGRRDRGLVIRGPEAGTWVGRINEMGVGAVRLCPHDLIDQKGHQGARVHQRA